MTPLHIIIPTFRRPNSQSTFSHLPPEWKKRTTFVLDQRDHDKLEPLFRYSGCQFVVHPPEIDSIAKKRAWIIMSKAWDKILMLDDDLRPCSRRTGTGLPTALPEEVDQIMETIQIKLDHFIHVGISARQGNVHLDPGWNLNTRMMYALGYDTKRLRKLVELGKITLGRVEYREDMELTLQLLKLRHPNAVYADICVDQRGYAKEGGVQADGRTVEKSNAEAEKLAALHPGLVRIVEKAYKTSVPRKEVVVSWKKAAAMGDATQKILEEEAREAATAHGQFGVGA